MDLNINFSNSQWDDIKEAFIWHKNSKLKKVKKESQLDFSAVDEGEIIETIKEKALDLVRDYKLSFNGDTENLSKPESYLVSLKELGGLKINNEDIYENMWKRNKPLHGWRTKDYPQYKTMDACENTVIRKNGWAVRSGGDLDRSITEKGEQFYSSLVARGIYKPSKKTEGEEWYQNKDAKGTKTPLSKNNIIKIKAYFESNDIPDNWVEAYEIIDSVPKNQNDIIQKLENIIYAPNVDNGHNDELINKINKTIKNIRGQ